ncbi:MAG: cytochrome C [candidate division KSB1 bacterium]|nr:cytochrome C [candidate division KSB1 bacterium]MDZ7301992.1 cytochrome C [candidate division KSB1 bacterium]MDZ7310174.1 cytochrome C [candidate division KSB1 bacterium]
MLLYRAQRAFPIFLLFMLPEVASAQISPGPLARPHRQLEGLTKCLSCHEVGKQTSNTKCLNCHVAIAGRLQARRGFHPTVTSVSASGSVKKTKPCASCHSEHNGRDFDLIVWEDGEGNFDHRQTGYMLEGKHAKVTCRHCHQPKFIREKFANDLTLRREKTFLGLSQQCMACHGDEHRGQLGNACERCHDFTAWKPAPKFSHDQAQFLLTGRHKQVPCAKCHFEKKAREKEGNETVAVFVQYTGLSFSNCIPCHQDPHRGRFGLDCVKCHDTESWMKIAGMSTFNHDVTDFPLRGRHREVKCEKCHIAGNFKKKLAHQFCRDCHEDVHGGQFAKRPDQGKCESCHRVEGFVPSQFTLAEHQQSRFPLMESHLAVHCGGCHTRQTSGKLAGKMLFVFSDQRCQVCHRDVHRGQFGKKDLVRCDKCHKLTLWADLLFVHNRDSSYKLDGAHEKVPCAKCHFQMQMKDHSFVVVYKPLRKECAACHR